MKPLRPSLFTRAHLWSREIGISHVLWASLHFLKYLSINVHFLLRISESLFYFWLEQDLTYFFLSFFLIEWNNNIDAVIILEMLNLIKFCIFTKPCRYCLVIKSKRNKRFKYSLLAVYIPLLVNGCDQLKSHYSLCFVWHRIYLVFLHCRGCLKILICGEKHSRYFIRNSIVFAWKYHTYIKKHTFKIML